MRFGGQVKTMRTAEQAPPTLKVGDMVEVRSEAEILATLDENGEYESLPFMPEMLRYSGQRLTVYKVAHKVCDTQTRSGMRRMENAVHLSGARCDGAAHGGCQASCLIYWKTAWLRKVERGAAAAQPVADVSAGAVAEPAAEKLLPLLTISSRRPPAEDGSEVYRCQATELLRAAPDVLPLRDPRQFVQDVRTGNVGVLWTIRTVFVALYNRAQGFSVRHVPPPLRFRGGRHWRFVRGTATKTPTGRTDLQPGDLVRVRSKAEIAQTLSANLLNRGLGFDNEMGRFCGHLGRVERRINRIIDERTGRMLEMRNPCIVLENVVCEGAYNLNCPRAITPYWREIWLEKVDEGRPPQREIPASAADDGRPPTRRREGAR
jgi:hypothetical protein